MIRISNHNSRNDVSILTPPSFWPFFPFIPPAPLISRVTVFRPFLREFFILTLRIYYGVFSPLGNDKFPPFLESTSSLPPLSSTFPCLGLDVVTSSAPLSSPLSLEEALCFFPYRSRKFILSVSSFSLAPISFFSMLTAPARDAETQYGSAEV